MSGHSFEQALCSNGFKSHSKQYIEAVLRNIDEDAEKWSFLCIRPIKFQKHAALSS